MHISVIPDFFKVQIIIFCFGLFYSVPLRFWFVTQLIFFLMKTIVICHSFGFLFFDVDAYDRTIKIWYVEAGLLFSLTYECFWFMCRHQYLYFSFRNQLRLVFIHYAFIYTKRYCRLINIWYLYMLIDNCFVAGVNKSSHKLTGLYISKIRITTLPLPVFVKHSPWLQIILGRFMSLFSLMRELASFCLK